MAANPRDPFGITGAILADKYKIANVIGEGGFSVVYKAEHVIWQQPVAIKCFKVLANAPEEYREQLLNDFIQEGRLMAKLSSRSASIVQARDVGTFTAQDGSWIPYMVLEWIEGTPLDMVLHYERLAGTPPRQVHEAIALLEPAAVAFEIAHAHGIAHRDIKPENLIVLGDARGPDAFVKVLDFGIAKVMDDHAAMGGHHSTKAVEPTAFTPSHGAPEQFSRSHGATGPWTDVFAMALTLVEVMRGGDAALEGNDYMQLAIASRDPARRPSPKTFGLPVSSEVEAVFLKALAVSPADRFASMGKFWAALHQAVFPGGPLWNPGSTAGLSSLLNLSTSNPGAPNTLVSGTSKSDETQSQRRVYTGQRSSVVRVDVDTQRAPSQGVSKQALIWGSIGVTALALGGIAALMMFGRNGKTNPAPLSSASASALLPSASAPASASKPTECPADMVLIGGGRFFMGSDDPGFKLWQPAHKVTLNSFCIDIHEVTVDAYKACSDKGDCKRPDDVPNYPKTPGPKEPTDEQHEKTRKTYAEFCNFGKPGREKHPINCVSWYLADGFCKTLGRRLPTEAEWEYAARGSDGRKFPWGDEAGDAQHMNAAGTEWGKWEASKGLPQSPRMYEADDGFVGTAPVGSFPKGKTKFGAYDVVGNVWEWTADWFQAYTADEQINPTGAPAGERKIIRGGSFNGGVQTWLNPAFRYHQEAKASSHGIGFRCALSL